MNDKKRLRRIIEGDKYLLKSGDIVTWSYRHHLNKKSSFINTKTGVFLRSIPSRSKPDEWWFPMCLVHFEGNKNPSKVKIEELEL